MGSVPDEVIEKVLLRLPDLGDLLRFSITCKHWYHYLSSKSFWKSRSLGQNDSFVSQVSFKMVSFKRKRPQVLSRVHARYDHVRCTYEDAGYKRRKLVVFDNSCVHTLTPPNVYSYVREILFKYNALTNRFLVGLVTQMHPFPLIRLVIYRSVTRKWSISEPLMQVLGRKKELCLPESIGRISGMRLAVVNYEKLVLEGRRVLQPNAENSWLILGRRSTFPASASKRTLGMPFRERIPVCSARGCSCGAPQIVSSIRFNWTLIARVAFAGQQGTPITVVMEMRSFE